MSVFETYAPGVQVNGESIMAVIEGMGAFENRAFNILSENHIDNPQPGNWYDLQRYLDAFKTISEELGPATLRVIGKKIPETAVLPPGLDTIEKALTLMDQAYHMNYKGGEIGHYSFQSTGAQKGVMICSSPYPCAYDQGIIMGFMNRLKKGNEWPAIKHSPGSCRTNGDAECRYDVSW
ncbi:MAG: hypothetical protein JXR76_13700 [Deltaproteobacteria bacterium]|nr:hypothetical protein [Deltaproteobacteria bacterium]